MRWFNFILLLLVGLIVQTGIGRLVGLGPQRVMPDLLGMLAVLLAFRGRGHQVLIACWILGAVRDLTSDAMLGTYALGFGIMGMLVMWFRELLYADRPLTIIFITLFSLFFVEQLAVIMSVVKGSLSWSRYGSVTMMIVFSALFTAALSPYGYWLVAKMHHFLGLPAGREYR